MENLGQCFKTLNNMENLAQSLETLYSNQRIRISIYYNIITTGKFPSYSSGFLQNYLTAAYIDRSLKSRKQFERHIPSY